MPLSTLSSVAQVRRLSCAESTPASIPLVHPAVIAVWPLPLLPFTTPHSKHMCVGAVAQIQQEVSLSVTVSAVAARVTPPSRSATVTSTT